MKDKKISQKLTLSFLIVNGIYLLGIAALLMSYMMSYDRLNNMNDQAVTPVVAMGKLREAISDERIAAEQLLFMEPGSGDYAEAVEVYELKHQGTAAAMDAYIAAATDEESRAAALDLREYYEGEYSGFIGGVISFAERDDDAAAVKLILASRSIEDGMSERMTGISNLVDERIAYYQHDAWVGMVRLFIIVVVVLAIIVFIMIYIIRYMNRVISRRIEKLTEAADLLAVGDLNIDISYDGTDEIGKLTDSFLSMTDNVREQAEALSAIAAGDLSADISPRCEQDTMNTSIKKMRDSLRDILSQIASSTDQVFSDSRQIAGGAQSLAQGTAEQAAAVEQFSGTMAAVAQISKDNSAMATRAAALIDSVNTNAEHGSEQMSRMAQAVEDIRVANQAINQVIKAIDAIAFQTNILSLNAAVEAARAGEHGKSFAIVAEEVRNLAAESAESARDTGVLIENSIAKAEMGAEIAGETVESFEKIVAGISESTGLLKDIARMSEQQSSAIVQMSQGIEQVSQVVQQNSATAENAAASSEKLSRQSGILERMTSQFRIKTPQD